MDEHLNQSSTEPAIFVIFGGTGNLAQHRLLPALYHLIKDKLLHEQTVIIGVSRHPMNTDELIDKVELCVLEDDGVCDPTVLKSFRSHLLTAQLDPTNGEDYDRLHDTLNSIEEAAGMCMNRLFYLAIPPQVYEPVIEHLGKHRLNEGCQHHRAESRLLVEKPFGYDLVSASELIAHTERYFHEAQVFRIDHYLAKETVQNIIVFRQHNPVFASVWGNRHVSAIDLRLSEQIGVEGRAEFYDNVGALRDVVQNHLMQLLALVTMELPHTSTSEALHRAKQTVLSAIEPVDPATSAVIRAQYAGYQAEVKNPGSTTETYASLQLVINNDRWRGVPITLMAGKALDSKRTTVSVTFTSEQESKATNCLTFRIQPDEGIDVALAVKRPGFDDRLETTHMDFSYANTFGNPSHPDAYERVLIDAVKGDHSLFATSGEVLESWRILQPILHAWELSSADLLHYEPGSSGPTVHDKT